MILWLKRVLSQECHGTILIFILFLSIIIIVIIQQVFFSHMAGSMGLQRAKKVVSDSPGLADLAAGLVIFVLNLPDGQVLFWGEIQITEGL